MAGGVAVAVMVAVGVVVKRWMDREKGWKKRLEEDPVYLAGLSAMMRREREMAERRQAEVEENVYEEMPGEKKE